MNMQSSPRNTKKPAFSLFAMGLLCSLLSSQGSIPSEQAPGKKGSGGSVATHREQRASRDLHGAKRYMDRTSIQEAQNILEEDDDLRGSTRLA